MNELCEHRFNVIARTTRRERQAAVTLGIVTHRAWPLSQSHNLLDSDGHSRRRQSSAQLLDISRHRNGSWLWQLSRS